MTMYMFCGTLIDPTGVTSPHTSMAAPRQMFASRQVFILSGTACSTRKKT